MTDAAKPAMEYRFLGNSGLKVSVLSLGGWVTQGAQVGDETAHECMKAAYDAGINFFDTAEVYAAGESERVMGEAIKKYGWKRSSLVISTKLYWGPNGGVNDRGLSRKHIIEGTNASLERLGLTYVDLIFAHRPDDLTPMEEIVRAFNHIIDQGKAFYWGTSEWSAEQLTDAFRKHGLGTTIWSPLASGSDPVMTRIRTALESPEGQAKLAKVDKLKVIADRLGVTVAQLALAWCVKNPNVSTVITGASRVSQLHENLKALEVVPKLTDEVMAEIEVALDNKPKLLLLASDLLLPQ
ncbi:NADP-dependent oxidoreductase domain-containing protein [Entophlyctis helioformis]|nr:NADP-dependent oxidoreductase domain-containing protein [Entophlyctis helioformis]